MTTCKKKKNDDLQKVMFNPKKLIANCGILGTEIRGLITLKSPQSKMKAMINRGRGGGFPQVQPVIPHLDHGTHAGNSPGHAEAHTTGASMLAAQGHTT